MQLNCPTTSPSPPCLRPIPTYTKGPQIFKKKNMHWNQGGKGEVVGQLSCIYETITTKILKKLKTFLFDFLNFQTKINLEKKISK